MLSAVSGLGLCGSVITHATLATHPPQAMAAAVPRENFSYFPEAVLCDWCGCGKHGEFGSVIKGGGGEGRWWYYKSKWFCALLWACARKQTLSFSFACLFVLATGMFIHADGVFQHSFLVN